MLSGKPVKYKMKRISSKISGQRDALEILRFFGDKLIDTFTVDYVVPLDLNATPRNHVGVNPS